MIYVIIFISIFYFAIAFIVTENNAKYLLSGYNTMSKDEKASFRLKEYIAYFKNFHLFLGFSNLIILLVIYYSLGINAAGIVLGIYPLIAYMYFIRKSQEFSVNKKLNKQHNLGFYILLGTLLFVAILFVIEFYL